jgi:hypothetical protein
VAWALPGLQFLAVSGLVLPPAFAEWQVGFSVRLVLPLEKRLPFHTVFIPADQLTTAQIDIIKKLRKFGAFQPCAQDWIRTSTPLRAPPPQSGLSTNFNTWATMKIGWQI